MLASTTAAVQLHRKVIILCVTMTETCVVLRVVTGGVHLSMTGVTVVVVACMGGRCAIAVSPLNGTISFIWRSPVTGPFL